MHAIVAKWCHEATYIWVNIASDNGLLPDGTKPSLETMLTNHLWGLEAFTWQQIFTGNYRDIYPWYVFKITNLSLQSHLQGANVLMWIWSICQSIPIKNKRGSLHGLFEGYFIPFMTKIGQRYESSICHYCWAIPLISSSGFGCKRQLDIFQQFVGPSAPWNMAGSIDAGFMFPRLKRHQLSSVTVIIKMN